VSEWNPAGAEEDRLHTTAEVVARDEIDGDRAGAAPEALQPEDELGARIEQVERRKYDEDRVEVRRAVVAGFDERARERVAVHRLPEDVVVVAEVDRPRGERVMVHDRETREEEAVSEPERDDGGAGGDLRDALARPRERRGVGGDGLTDGRPLAERAVDRDADRRREERGIKQRELGAVFFDALLEERETKRSTEEGRRERADLGPCGRDAERSASNLGVERDADDREHDDAEDDRDANARGLLILVRDLVVLEPLEPLGLGEPERRAEGDRREHGHDEVGRPGLREARGEERYRLDDARNARSDGAHVGAPS